MQSQCIVVCLIALFGQISVPKLVAQDATTGPAKHPRYRLLHLGTFGGPVSLVTGGNGDLNQHKTLVTSCAATSVLDPEWPNINPWTDDEPYIYHAFRTRGGHLEDLGALPGGTTSCGQGIDTNGTVAGFSTNAEIDPLTGHPESHATFWQHGKILDLGTFTLISIGDDVNAASMRPKLYRCNPASIAELHSNGSLERYI